MSLLSQSVIHRPSADALRPCHRSPVGPNWLAAPTELVAGSIRTIIEASVSAQSARPSEASARGFWRAIVACGATTVGGSPDAGGDGLELELELGLGLALGLGPKVGPGWPSSPV